MLTAWTDYPITELGDKPYVEAPVREVQVISYDFDKYCEIIVGGVSKSIKAGYLYKAPGRCNVDPPAEPVERATLHGLPRTKC